MAALLLALLLLLPASAHAYIDPSAGSIVLQLLLGGIAGVLVAAKLYWRKLAGLFGRRQLPADDRDVKR